MSSIDVSPYDPDYFNPNIWLKDQAKALGVPAKALLAMAPQRDPFNCGTKTDWTMARWFKKQYEEYGYQGIHLRRLHYRISNLGEGLILLWNDIPYDNNPYCWSKIQEAFTACRILGLVDADAFVERRVKASRVDSLSVYGLPEPGYEVHSPLFGSLPDAPYSVMPNLIGSGNITYYSPTFEVSGYDYDPNLQPFIIELWDEKSGDMDLMRRLAFDFGVNYQPGVGYASITNIKKMLKRVASYGKPARILYVSDYDDAGQNMPITVARHSQFGIWELTEVAEEIAPEVMVDSAALTPEQIERLDLPTFTNTTKVEVDALEALHPGELERILIDRIGGLQDSGMRTKVGEAREIAEGAVRDSVRAVVGRHQEELEAIQTEADEIAERYRAYYRALGEKMQARYERLGRRYEREIAELKERVEQEQNEIAEELANLDVSLPEIAEPDVPEANGWLFDSKRDFLDQTMRFRETKGME